MKVAKNRGIILGKHGKNVLSQQNIKLADDFAETMIPIISELKSEGFVTPWAIRLLRAVMDTWRKRGQSAYENLKIALDLWQLSPKFA